MRLSGFLVLIFGVGSSASEVSVFHSASVPVQLADIGLVHVNATAHDDVSAVAAAFCREHDIHHRRCAHFVAVDLWDALWCQPGQKVAARKLGLVPPRTFRFAHHAQHFDSDEFSLLRPRLQSNGFVECVAGLELTGEEDAVWMLGHLSSRNGDSSKWFYEPLAAAADSKVGLGGALANQFPDAGHLGTFVSCPLSPLRLPFRSASHYSPIVW
jgi:hypothetical protein